MARVSLSSVLGLALLVVVAADEPTEAPPAEHRAHDANTPVLYAAASHPTVPAATSVLSNTPADTYPLYADDSQLFGYAPVAGYNALTYNAYTAASLGYPFYSGLSYPFQYTYQPAAYNYPVAYNYPAAYNYNYVPYVSAPAVHHVDTVVKHVEPVVKHVEPVVVKHVEPVVVKHVEPVVKHVEPVVVKHVEPVVKHVEPVVVKHVEPIVVKHVEPVVVKHVEPVVVKHVEPVVVKHVVPATKLASSSHHLHHVSDHHGHGKTEYSTTVKHHPGATSHVNVKLGH